ncbi:uncharacterized protein AKAW2_51503A [Aspergillus luchuensis]|uniref:Uncharacterized protein n=1 Tax=Aspergillus kawachii TaxID=1069201 RepID=A0A7R7WDT5_ASPKA|nr:uncharacterized protein AKAW2_51503A [Aspergillus luchuensis]BCS01162.1 hypothetical protein AKAW2_51503A [Aspergillus luchuensis]
MIVYRSHRLLSPHIVGEGWQISCYDLLSMTPSKRIGMFIGTTCCSSMMSPTVRYLYQ